MGALLLRQLVQLDRCEHLPHAPQLAGGVGLKDAADADADGAAGVGLHDAHNRSSRQPEASEHVVDLPREALDEDLEALQAGQRRTPGAELDRDRDGAGAQGQRTFSAAVSSAANGLLSSAAAITGRSGWSTSDRRRTNGRRPARRTTSAA